MPRVDPRPARSRAKLVAAAAGLLRESGPAGVTVDAVVGAADVSRATFYRHFPSTSELVAAAFGAVIPAAPAPPDSGSFRERLTALVVAQARLFADVPATTTVLAWLSLGADLGERFARGGPDDHDDADGTATRTVREQVAGQYLRPFDEVLSSPAALEVVGDVDRITAMALLIGPLAMGRLSTLHSFDYDTVARAAVDGFIATHRRD